MFSPHVCQCTECMPCDFRSQKRILYSLEIELQMVVSHYVVSETQTRSSLEHQMLETAKPSISPVPPPSSFFYDVTEKGEVVPVINTLHSHN